MESLEIFNEDENDIQFSSITLKVYKVQNGFIPNWSFTVRDETTIEELLALRDGIELVRVQFDRLMDMILSEDDDEEE